jgi:hypothetical protein
MSTQDKHVLGHSPLADHRWCGNDGAVVEPSVYVAVGRRNEAALVHRDLFQRSSALTLSLVLHLLTTIVGAAELKRGLPG